MVFRQQTPASLHTLANVDLLVSDLHVHTRGYSEETFKRRHPDRRALVQLNQEGLGLVGTWFMLPKQRFESLGMLDPAFGKISPATQVIHDGIYPLLDFPGHWVLDAGAQTLEDIPADPELLTVRVSDTTPFKPSAYRLTLAAARKAGNPPNALDRDVVIHARAADGKPDWTGACFASVKRIDEAEKTITLLRWRTGTPWRAFPAGSVVAPNAVLQFDPSPMPRGLPAAVKKRLEEFSMVKPWLPNYTQLCPKDPRTGLTAAQTLAKHYLAVKKKSYPLSDGFVFDVSASCMHPGDKLSNRVDCDNDGNIDNFILGGSNFYAPGYYDFCWYLRNGLPGVFEGLPDITLVWDSNRNYDQRFFDLFNGAEYEHRMIMMWAPQAHAFSSSLDRLLLWGERAVSPRMTVVHNKYPDEAYHGGDIKALKRPCTLADFRLDIASSCMADGYIGKWPLRVAGDVPESAADIPNKKQWLREFKGLPPLPYDEFHAGNLNRPNWLGAPVSKPLRVAGNAGKPLFQWAADTPLPSVTTQGKAWQAEPPARKGAGFDVKVTSVGRYEGFKDDFKLALRIPLAAPVAAGREYTLRLRAMSDSPWSALGERYAGIPRSIHVRLIGGEAPFAGQPGDDLAQEFLVFTKEREVLLTLRTPRAGEGFLEFGIAEDPGTIGFREISLAEGCADVLIREFENGLVALNGSYLETAHIDLAKRLPGRKFVRLAGTQDPAHNNGQTVGATLDLAPLDGILLLAAPVE